MAMELNEAQIEALKKLSRHGTDSPNYDGAANFEEFMARCSPLIGEPKVAMIRAYGMTVGIEVDGYTHT